MLIFCIQFDLIGAQGVDNQAGTDGNNDNSCSQISDKCLTLDVSPQKVNIADEFTVFVEFKMTVSSTFTISSQQSSRTFTNYPESSTTQNEIEILNVNWLFTITGKARFQYLKFIVQGTDSYRY
ncbi:MAG: hypothetical protein EZS28_026120 [Streblomastix strix]|uniref:Uncharacterized protein n=1 Tax=Streblomastix strix TaxID=222440 RepID=A0A5J4V7F3_9EUKA|nr:MAG: hypothetical protein EZS28_026120 [Streblomastix strix]